MRRHILAMLASAGIISSCAEPEMVRTGDLVFVGIPADLQTGGMTSAIADATGSGELNFVHAAIIDVDTDGSIWIVDANTNHGVARTSLSEFIIDNSFKDGSLPVFEVMRIRGEKDCSPYVERAKSFIGQPYDYWFLPGNKACYCTELIYDSYIKENGGRIFDAAPMNFKSSDGSFPEYWVKLFDELGEEIPQGVDGTNPQDMHASRCLVRLDVDIFRK